MKKALIVRCFCMLISNLILFTTQAQKRDNCAVLPALPFKVDSTVPFLNEEGLNRVLPAITQSGACLEVRRYLVSNMNINNGEVEVIRLLPDSVVFERYKYIYTYLTPLGDGYEYIGRRHGDRYCVNRKIIRIPVNTTARKLISRLRKSGIFTYPGQSVVLDSLRAAGVVVKDPCEGITDCGSPVVFEVKYGNKLRNFKTVNPDYYSSNRQITALRSQFLINKLFSQYFFPKP